MTTLDLDRSASEQRAVWNDLVGDAWVRHADLHDRQAEPFGSAAMHHLGILTGATVLDVGCGTGATCNDARRSRRPQGDGSRHQRADDQRGASWQPLPRGLLQPR